jgi:hypothetical protein
MYGGGYGQYGGGYGQYGGAGEMRSDMWINQNIPGGINSKPLQLFIFLNI